MKPIKLTFVLAAALLALSASAVTWAGAASSKPQTASAAARQFEGTVLSVDRDAKTFRLRDVERGTKRFKVTARTRFERIDGLAGLKAGAKNIEVTAKRKNGKWIALEVERSGGGGEHGGDDRGGDDRGGSGRGGDDDPAGDDHGSR
jgi:Domain of unknown function (DUF5666)